MRKTSYHLICAVMLAVCSGFSSSALAANVFFNVANGDWNVASNWNPAYLPGSTTQDSAILDFKTCNVTSAAAIAYTTRVYVRDGSAMNISADMPNTGSWSIGTAVGATAQVNQTAGTVTSIWEITIGNGSPACSYNLSGGTINNMGNPYYLNVTGTGGQLNISETGDCRLYRGLQVNNGANVNVTGGSLWTDSNNDAGTGNSLVINAGGTVTISGGSVWFDSQSDVDGTLAVVGTAPTITMGDAANGSVTSASTGTFKFVLGAAGVSTITSDSASADFQNAKLVIDGSAYAGATPATITLFNTAGLAAGGQFNSANVTVSGLGNEGTGWNLIQNAAAGDIILTIPVRPLYATDPNPPNGAMGVSVLPTLSWAAGSGATSHNVYFGATNPPSFAVTQTGTSYSPGTLTRGTTYYWRVDETNGGGTVTGDTWSFSVPTLLSPVFECTRFRLTFDGSGRVSSLFYKPLNRELIIGTTGNEGFAVYNTGGSDVALTTVNRTGNGKLLASSANGQYQVTLGIVEQDRHISFKIEELVGFPISSNLKLRFKINPNITSAVSGSAIPVKYGGGVGVGVVSLDYMTVASGSFNVQWDYLWHRGYNSADPIGGFAIFVCGDSETLETTGLVEVAEGLPHPMYGGQWAKVNNIVGRLSQIYVSFSGTAERTRAVDYAQQGGLGIFYLPQGVWESGSPYRINTYNWPNGESDLRAFSDDLWSRGMLLGVHTGSMSLWNADKVYVSPIPDDRLATWGRGTLAQAVSSSGSVIYFTPDAGTVLPTITGGTSSGLRPPVYNSIWGYGKIRIGNEVISVGSFNTSAVPWILSGCSRGQEGTSAAAHSSSDLVRGLLTVYGHLAVDPDSTLLQEIADKMAAVVNSCNIGRLSFDALETAESSGRPWGMNKFMTKAYEGFDHFVATDSSSGLPQWEWHMAAYANNGEPMHFYPKAYFEGYLIGGAVENFVPEALGAVTFRKDDRNSAWHASTPDEWEWWLAKAAAYDATYWFWSSVSELDGNGQAGEILDLCKKWERAKLMNVFTSAQRTQMKDYYTTFQLTSSDINSFSWQISPSKITPAFVKSGNTASVTNSYTAQPLQFEARVLPYYDYASASNMALLPANVSDLTIDSGLSVTKNASNEWTFVSSSSSPKQANRSISTTDLSYKRGVGLWIKGNNKGGYFYIEYSSGAYRHYIVPNNFIDWRYVEIPDFEAADYLYRDTLHNYFQDPYLSIRQGFRYNAISRISFGITAVPTGNTATVIIKEPKAMEENAVSLANLQLSFDSSVLTVNGSVNSGSYIAYGGGSSVNILDSNRFASGTLPVTISNWSIPAGTSSIAVSSTSTNQPWVKLLFKTVGTSFTIPNPMDADINDDQAINLLDFQILAQNWLKNEVVLPGDLDRNNCIDLEDFSRMAADWLK